MNHKPVILASQSPRRAELLRQIAVSFEVMVADIDERPMASEDSMAYLQRMAKAKALAVQETLHSQTGLREPVIIAADTIGELDGEILLKPTDQDDAIRMLLRMSGRSHSIATGVCVLAGDKCDYLEVKTQVSFRSLNEPEIKRYWATGEPQDKAGAYGIQGLGAVFVERINGSYSNVVGLPLCETARLLQNAGVRLWQSEQAHS